MSKTKMKPVVVGAVVAFNTLPDAAWFDVVAVEGFELTVREHGTQNRTQRIDKSLVKQVR